MPEERRDIFDSITPRFTRMALGVVVIGLLLLGGAVKFGQSFGWIDGGTSEPNPSSNIAPGGDQTITVKAVCERLINSESLEVSWAFGTGEIVRIRGLDALAMGPGSKLDRQVESAGTTPPSYYG